MCKLTPARKNILRMLADGGKIIFKAAHTQTTMHYTLKQIPDAYWLRTVDGDKLTLRADAVLCLQHHLYLSHDYAITAQGRDAVAQGAA